MGSCLSSKSARKARPGHQQPLLGVRHLACASQPDTRNMSPACTFTLTTTSTTAACPRPCPPP